MKKDSSTGEAGAVKIRKISWLTRCRLCARPLEHSQTLADRLAAWNQELWSPERILETLGLVEADLRLLRDLSRRRQGWRPFKFDARAGAEAARPASLGLIRLCRWRRRVRLTTAGRVILLLTEIDPKIK
ncbi:MAG: hypothetical protein FWG97_03205 [Deltaproteobacteria bacterium]|nr:hypothetical protein [Deltaproteobacteria bacterium]